MLPAEDDVAELTRAIWETVLGLAVEGPFERGGDQLDLSLSVDITGSWEGTVSLSMPKDLAVSAAAVMIGVPEEDVPPGELRDAVGELANMLGGNVKGILPGTNKLSLPRVEVVPAPPAIGAVEARRLWFESGGKSFSVTVARR
jgi:chemotaxis protein CheX